MNGVLSGPTVMWHGTVAGIERVGEGMAEPRKIFRIEQTAAAHLEKPADTAQAGLRYAEIVQELRALRAALAITTPRPRTSGAPATSEAKRLTSELNLIAGAIGAGSGDAERREPDGGNSAQANGPMTRIDQELRAVVSGTEQATQRILAAAEEIDSTANTLSAALNGRIEQALAQDIQDLVIRIFEACNFQDLIGQRVTKVSATVKFVEEHIARVLEEIKTASAMATALQGPRLDGDDGHASQDDIDAMFANTRAAGSVQ
jgi:chemotaxis protein CheZ